MYGFKRKRSRGRKAHVASRRAYRKAIRTPKKVLAKKYANTIGQIVSRSGRMRPSHRRF